MTQTQRAACPWLAPLPADDITNYIRSSMTAACRGHEKMGALLGFFFYEASWKAKNEGIVTEKQTFIELTHTHEDILKRVTISKKSLNNYLKQLAAWGYVEATAYGRTYKVYFKKIAEAIKTPPEKVKALPRGRYAPPKPKPTQEEIDARKRLNLQTKLVNLQQKLVNLQTKEVNLQQKLVNLQTYQRCESAPEQAFMADFEATRIDRSNKNLKEYSLVENIPSSLSADADDGVSFEEKEEKGRTNGNSPLAYSGTTQQYSDQPLLHPLQASGDTHGTTRTQLETLTEDEEAQEDVGESQEKAPNAPTTDPSPDSQVTTPTDDTLQPALLDAPTPEQIPIPASTRKTHTKDGCKISGTPPPQPAKPKKPETVLLCQPRTLRELIDANRGHSLEERGAIIHQNIVLKDWCAAHPLEHYYLVLEHLKSCRCKNPAHQWWHKEEHWRFLSAEKLAELTPSVLSELGKIPKPPPPEEARAAPLPPVSRGWSPVMTPCPRGR